MDHDFITTQNKTFGSNQIKKGSSWYIYRGNVNQDELVNISDLIIIDNNAFIYSSGYLAADLNGDNTIDLNDLILCDNNSYNSVSTIKP